MTDPPSYVRRETRRATVLVAVITCLGVATLLMAALTRTTLTARRQLRVEYERLQAEWLVEAGMERAAFALRENADYQGETWLLKEGAIAVRHEGRVEIRVEATRTADLRQVTVVAHYPANTDTAVRRGKSILVAIPILTDETTRSLSQPEM